MITINVVSMVCVVINLIVLYILYKKFLYNRLMKMLDERKDTLHQQYASAKRAKRKARRLKKQYEDSLHGAQEESMQIIEDAKARAESLYQKRVEEAQAEADEILKKAQAQIQSEREQAEREAQMEITKLAMAAAAKIIGESTGSESDSRLYDQFLNKTGGKE